MIINIYWGIRVITAYIKKYKYTSVQIMNIWILKSRIHFIYSLSDSKYIKLLI